jgi:Polyketide cyclase / dehydrase and lipid transport
MPQPEKRFWGFLIGVAVGVLCEVGGYLLMRGNQGSFGAVVFFVVPFISGFFIAIFTARGTRLFASLLGSLLLALSLLIFLGLEGYICCCMAFPLLFAGVSIGVLIGMGVKSGWVKDGDKKSPLIKILLLVFAAGFLVGAKRIERPLIEKPRYETFEERVTVTGSADRAWNLIKSMDRLNGPKPFLLWFGLPLPQSCEVDHEAVGGKRVCHFDSGIIAQEITEWNSPRSMKFKITESTLPGRHWLKFVSAGYDFIPDGGNTVVVRKTTISSRLYPRWYWRMFEEWGVQSEHEFVLTDLQRRAELERKY